ncbi:hypothetical protein [Paenibacillus apiarius]|uniref:hypothetical protein n=1 Tax=Paenibacillus apiarius TaxID=46240 RepID=UPI00197F62CC|nr:hypothetical protein [Paenibacillus apiarius]MBN3526634.1 hypothetical protein [Paenibacillus apiarius]
MAESAIYYLKNVYGYGGTEKVIEILSAFPNINQTIHFAYIESNMDSEKQETIMYLQKNKSIVSREWLFPYQAPKAVPSILWYKTTEKIDIRIAISIESLFRCIVLSNEKPIHEAAYVFYVIEDEYNQVLCIYAKDKEDFNNRVLPAILRLDASIAISKEL